MSVGFGTTEEAERDLGTRFRELRLSLDLDQLTLAKLANVSPSALKSLEAGRGSTLRTALRVARALGRPDWGSSIYEQPEVSPMDVLRARQGLSRPRRASRRARKA